MENNIELLSPAGGIKSFEAAIKSGANAIYMGLTNFNAREMAENFSVEEYKKCILKAHILNIKVYLTLNTLLFDNEIEDALKLVLELYNVGLDAIIIQDIGLAMKIHEILPDLPLHASTQMSVYSLEQVNFLKNLGFKRVVLARELTFSEIEYIAKNTDMELEVFVHGALCVSFSGQCLMSKMIGDRSANRGSCAQPCRKKYSIVDSNRNVVIKDAYLLSKKDTFGLEYINKLKDVGVASLKIEGRNRTPEYVYLVTSIYRKYLDENKSNIELKDIRNIMQIFNRSGLSKNYLEGVKKDESISYKTPKNTGLYLGKVVSTKKEYVKVKLEDNIDIHDGIEIYTSDSRVVSNIVTCIRDDNYKIVNTEMKKGEYVFLGDIKEKVSPGDLVYKTSSSKLNKELSSKIDDKINFNKREIIVDIYASLNEKIKYITYINDKKIEVISDDICEKSENKSLTKLDFINNLLKSVDTLFNFKIGKFEVENGLYIKVSALNSLRNDLISKLKEAFSTNKNIDIDNILKASLKENLKISNYNNIQNENALFIYDYDENIDYNKYYEKFKDERKLKRLYINILYGYKDIKVFKNIVKKYSNLEIYLYIPNVVLNNGKDYINKNIENIINTGIKGFILSSYHFYDLIIKYKEKYNLKLIADYKLNITNTLSCNFIKDLGFDILIPSIEASEEDIENMSKIIPLELLKNKVTVMTTRYCILSSFLRDKSKKKCNMPCLKNKYKLMDERNYTYDIYASNIDCMSEYVRSYKSNYSDNINNMISNRYSV